MGGWCSQVTGCGTAEWASEQVTHGVQAWPLKGDRTPACMVGSPVPQATLAAHAPARPAPLGAPLLCCPSGQGPAGWLQGLAAGSRVRRSRVGPVFRPWVSTHR